jgi:hypothetical protein
MATSTPPPGLSETARAFWDGTLGKYELSPSEVEVLRRVVALMSTADAVNDALLEHGPTTTTAHGSVTASPLIAQSVAIASQIARLLAVLALPDEDGSTLSSPKAATNRANGAMSSSNQQGAWR